MILYVNGRGEIKDVNITNNMGLIPIEVNDTEENPFKDWSEAKILCHKVSVIDGVINWYGPYVDTKIVDAIDKLGKADESAAVDILDTQIALTETFEKALSSEADITDIQLALVELYEMIAGGNE